MINLVKSSPTAIDSSTANSDLKQAKEGTQVASASAKGSNDKEKLNKVWTIEYDLALLEEVGNCNAHILEQKKTKNSRIYAAFFDFHMFLKV
jgi:hypothetical protein